MTRDKITEMLSETICVTREEARAALEAREWDVLDAARLLQQESARAEIARSNRARRGEDLKIVSAFRGLIARLRGNRAVERENSPAPEQPVAAKAPAMILPSAVACRCR